MALFAPLLCVALVAGPRAETGYSLLELVIDGRATERVGRFEMRDGVPHASANEWRALGLRLPEGAATGEDGLLLSVTALPGVLAHVDAAAQTLVVTLAPDASKVSLIGAPQASSPRDEEAGDSGAVLNYDLTLQRSAAALRSAGLFDARLFGPLGLLEQTLLASDNSRPHALRLDTTWTQIDAPQLRRLRAGDFIPVALGWTRPVRMGGVQWMTDFALRPDLVTAPLPSLTGSAAVPSTVDVLVNGVRQLSQPVDAGRFEVRQLPIVSGQGEIAVVVRDALGRESVQRLPFYASMHQLASGLSAYSLELGRIRRGWGQTNGGYGDAAAQATLRHGATDRLTLEAHAEAGRDVALAGGGALINVGDLGLVNASLATSRGSERSGRQASLGAERQSSTSSVNLALTQASAGYRDIAAAEGDAVLRHSARFGAGLGLGGLGSLGIALVATETAVMPLAPARRTRIASGSYSVSLADGRAQFFASAFRDSMPGGGRGVSISLMLPLGGRGGVSASLTRDRNGSGASLQAGESALVAGDFGWRAQTDEGLSGSLATRRLAGIEYRAPWARLAAEAEQVAGASATRVGVQGALVALGGQLHATLPVADSLAVVTLDGQPGVAVYHENRLVGQTDANGQIVVPNLLSHQINRIAIDPLDLPMDADVDGLSRELRPSDRVGVVLRFALQRSRSALLVLRDAAGAPLPLGAQVLLTGGNTDADGKGGDGPAEGEPFVVGYDGLAYLRGLSEHNRIAVHWAGHPGCTGHFEWAALDRTSGRIGPVRCE
jgi:outer membrane usher protein